MTRFYDDPIESEDGRAPPLAPLALLLLTYGSTLVAPHLLRELRSYYPGEFEWSSGSGVWLPTAAAASCALGIAIAIMMALSRMIRDLQSRPYAALGPALGALLGMALIALRAPFSLYGADSATLAALLVSVSMVGGALVQAGGAGGVLLGLMLAALPTGAVAGWLWTTRPPGGDLAQSLAESLAECQVPDRAFLVLLALVGALMTCMALLARALHGRMRGPDWQSAHEVMRHSWPAARSALRDSISWSAGWSNNWSNKVSRKLNDTWAGVSAFRTSLASPSRTPAELPRLSGDHSRFAQPRSDHSRFAQPRSDISRFARARTSFAQARTGAVRKMKTLWNTKAGEAPPYGFSVWRYHDDVDADTDTRVSDSDVMDSLRKSSRVWPVVLVFAGLAGAALLLGLWLAHR